MRDFLSQAFLSVTDTENEIYVCSLPNVKGDEPAERHVVTRDLERIEKFAEKWDQKGRGLFFCVSTLKNNTRRVKDNVINAVMLHSDTDLKDIDVPIDEAVSAILGMAFPPTVLVLSGRGIHSYWLFTEPTSDFDRVEQALKRLAHVVAGDMAVTHRVALMRMPGSHNTKNDTWTEVKIVHNSGTRYELHDLEEWLRTEKPVIAKKGEEEPGNPYLEVAEIYSFKPPVDVDQRLAEMEFEGEGDKAVHKTQLSCVAALLASGVELDDVVAQVLEATKAVCPADWNWVKEERKIRKLATDFLPKLEQRKQERAAANGESAVVVSLDSKRKKETSTEDYVVGEAPKKKGKKDNTHVVLGEGVIRAIRFVGEDILITRGEQVYRFKDSLWRALQKEEAQGWINREVEEGCRTIGIVSTMRVVSESRAWIYRNKEIYKDEVNWDSHGKIPTTSGLMDPDTLEIEEPRPEDYTTYCIPVVYDPSAKCPWWEQMLRDTFPDDQATIDVVQEVVGMALLNNKPKDLMRALIFIGQSNSGKSNLLNVIGGFISLKLNMTPFDTLETPHGLMPFLKHEPWVLHEAFDQGKWQVSSHVKSLISGDAVEANVKNGPIITFKYRAPVFWGSNAPPQFKESTKAMENRLVIIKCPRVFDSNELVGTAKKAREAGYASPAEFVLDHERSGIFNWALVGMHRARENGRFSLTRPMVDALAEMHRDSNLVMGFIEDAVEFSPDHMVSKPDFYAAFSAWWEENRGERRPPSMDAVGRALSSLYDNRIASDKEKLRLNNKRYLAGIKLNEMGMDYWQTNYNHTAVSGSSLRISPSAKDVNASIPSSWNDWDKIASMRSEQKKLKK